MILPRLRSVPFVLGYPAAFLALQLMLGCRSVEERAAEDQAEVESGLRDRLQIGSESAPDGPDDGSIPTAALDLLKDGLTEEEAVKVALLNSRKAREVFEELGIARAALVQAGLLSNPVLSANANFFRSGTEVELGLSQSLLEVLFVPLRRRVAWADLAASKAEVSRKIVRLVFAVRGSFADLLASEKLVDMRRQALAAAQASFDLMSRLHGAGNVIDQQLTAEEVLLTRARLELSRAEAQVREAREALNEELGIWGTATDWRPSGELGADPAAGLELPRAESRSIEASFSLASTRAEAEAWAQRAGLATWEGVFSVADVGPVAKPESGDGWGAGAGGTLSLPIFDHGQARQAAARAELRRTLNRQVSQAVEVRSRARQLRDRLLALREQALYMSTVHLPLRGRLVRETVQNFNAMQVGVFDVLQTRQQQLEAEREYVETLRSAWRARLDLEELLAGGEPPWAANSAGGLTAETESLRERKGQ